MAGRRSGDGRCGARAPVRQGQLGSEGGRRSAARWGDLVQPGRLATVRHDQGTTAARATQQDRPARRPGCGTPGHMKRLMEVSTGVYVATGDLYVTNSTVAADGHGGVVWVDAAGTGRPPGGLGAGARQLHLP